MPIGTITPGSYVTVTPDGSIPAPYASFTAPSATMPVIASDIQALTLMALNIGKMSIDGIHGGTYAPSATISIGGLGLSVSSALNIPSSGVIALAGQMSLASGSSFAGSSNFFGVYALGDGTTSVGVLQVTQNSSISVLANGTINNTGTIDNKSGSTTIYRSGSALSTSVGATATFHGDVTTDTTSSTVTNGPFQTNGNAAFTGPTFVTGAVSLGNVVQIGANGGIREHEISVGTGTYSINDANVIDATLATVAGNTTITLVKNAAWSTGRSMLIIARAANTCTINYVDGTLNIAGGGGTFWAIIRNRGGGAGGTLYVAQVGT